jgi:hypothetical protein
VKDRSRFEQFLSAVSEIPMPVIGVVVLGVLATVAVGYVNHAGGQSTTEVTWETTESVPAAGPVAFGPDGSISLERGRVSATLPTVRGDFLYRVSGLVRIQSPGRQSLGVECGVESLAVDSLIARTVRKRAAWPRPSDDLARQEVPEAATIRFRVNGAEFASIPLRDAINRYTDSARLTTAEWPGYDEDRQGWVWTFPQGTGVGTVSLGYIVVFRTRYRPRVRIECQVRSPSSEAKVSTSFLQDEWPLARKTR